MNKLIVFMSLSMGCVINAISPDTHFFSIVNNTPINFDIEISYGTKGALAPSAGRVKKPDVEIGEHYEDKQLFTFHVGSSIDIQKNQIKRFPMFIRLLSESAGGHSSGAEVFQRGDRTVRKQIGIGVDNVNNKNGVVFNQDSRGEISYKFYDVRPDTKVIRQTNRLMDDDR